MFKLTVAQAKALTKGVEGEDLKDTDIVFLTEQNEDGSIWITSDEEDLNNVVLLECDGNIIYG